MSSLIQPITPNTAEGKPVQYSALWSDDNNYIIQIGMYPEAVSKATKKNSLSHIFSLIQGTKGVSYFAMDKESGVIIGSSNPSYNDMHYSKLGFSENSIKTLPVGDHITIDGVSSYVCFKEIHGNIVCYSITTTQLYRNIPFYTLLIIFCLIIIAFIMVVAIKRFTDKHIISSIQTINQKLRDVTEGNLEERVGDQSTLEFSELSSHINHMIVSLLKGTDKIGFVLDKTNLKIGVYEYNSAMKTVRFTERVQEILCLDDQSFAHLCEDYNNLVHFINELRTSAVSGMDNTYRYVVKDKELYLKLEETTNENDVLGVIIDATEDTKKLLSAEVERDFDVLCDLYNRRGMERVFNLLFNDLECIKNSALVVIDTDRLKHINDTYGHASGDLYLKKMAELLKNFDAPEKLAARVGGDEFVLFIYGYDSEESLVEALNGIRKLQDSTDVVLENKEVIKLHFSYGYQIVRENQNYNALLSVADEYMYSSKRIRKLVLTEFNDKSTGKISADKE